MVRSPRPICAVQRARLWAITCTATRRRWRRSGRTHVVQIDAVLEVSNGVLDLGVAAVVGLQFQHLPVPVGDEAVIAIGGEEGQLGTGHGLHPPDDEPHRRGVRLGLERGVEPVSEAKHEAEFRRSYLLCYRLHPHRDVSQLYIW